MRQCQRWLRARARRLPGAAAPVGRRRRREIVAVLRPRTRRRDDGAVRNHHRPRRLPRQRPRSGLDRGARALSRGGMGGALERRATDVQPGDVPTGRDELRWTRRRPAHRGRDRASRRSFVSMWARARGRRTRIRSRFAIPHCGAPVSRSPPVSKCRQGSAVPSRSTCRSTSSTRRAGSQSAARRHWRPHWWRDGRTGFRSLTAPAETPPPHRRPGRPRSGRRRCDRRPSARSDAWDRCRPHRGPDSVRPVRCGRRRRRSRAAAT